MSNLTVAQDVEMSSLDFLKGYINPCREVMGENPVTNSKFKAKIMDELDLDESVGHLFQPPQGGTPQWVVTLNYDQMLLVGMRESKSVRRSVLGMLKALTVSPPVSHKPEAVRRAEEYQAIHILLNDFDPALVLQERERLYGTPPKQITPPASTYNSEMQCPVVRFLNSHMKMGRGLSITSHDLFWAINDHYDFFTSQAKITRIVKLLHLQGVEHGQVRRAGDNKYHRGFKGLGLL